MSKKKSAHSKLISFSVAVFSICFSLESYSQSGKSVPEPGLSSNESVKSVCYSKSASDSISRIIFGKIFINASASAISASPNVQVAGKAEAVAAKKKNKFTIKSTDKLKTNSSLY